MFKIKKKIAQPKSPVLYNIIEDYSEFDAPGNVTACAMTLPEDLSAHAKVLSESYDVPLDTMTKLLIEGGVYVYPQEGGLLTRGLFACVMDESRQSPKQTFTLDVVQFDEAERMARARSISLTEAAKDVLYRTLPDELKAKLAVPSIVPSRKGATSSTLISAKTGRLISSGSASCRMVGWLKPVGWKNSLSSTGSRHRKPKRWSSREGPWKWAMKCWRVRL